MPLTPDVIEGGQGPHNWKENPRYQHLVLYEGACWRVYLHEQQNYLGRVYLWLTTRHVPNHQFYDLDQHELRELQQLLAAYHLAITQLWEPHTLNYYWAGNHAAHHDGHGHLHVIPRYKSAPVLEGYGFPDHRFGKNHSPYEKRKIPEWLTENILATLKLRLAAALA